MKDLVKRIESKNIIICPGIFREGLLWYRPPFFITIIP